MDIEKLKTECDIVLTATKFVKEVIKTSIRDKSFDEDLYYMYSVFYANGDEVDFRFKNLLEFKEQLLWITN